ncbi:hypothetical protein IW140_001787 [Coemansia sp. RSA 1813]|nr:hypothetical protein EV178_002581 [Coemansia sp. RSA 1646]KAJ2211647.1 hypothetical protein EV179_005319 [Coemansia sp. RSA 487]KAJ2571085.1 hypothetical protein IW140_001787 [Coemansia sp. RSA 1813]
MYANSRKASRETCASSPSPASSPATPSAEPNPSEPLFAEYSSQSAMLDSIGAWSSVQPIPASHAPLAVGAYKSAADIRELRGRYGAMNLDHKLQQQPAPYPGIDATGSLNSNSSNVLGVENMRGGSGAVGGAGSGHSTADVDYSELDEAILRGRSTTLPNIFAVPNPVYRFSTVASIDTSGSPGPISPASSSTLDMLSRHGSMSISNSNRTVSPLGVSISSNPIHRTASLDNPLTSPLDPIHTAATATARYEAAAAAANASGLHSRANPNISGSVSSTGTLVGIGGTSAVPIRRLSEYPTEMPHPALSLASYSMGPALGSNSGAGDASVNGNDSGGVSHGGAGRASLTPLSISGITGNASSSSSQSAAQVSAIAGTNPSAGNGQLTNEHPSDSSAYPPGMHARYAQFGHHLPTMREEDASTTLEPTAALANSTLMCNMSMPSFGNSPMSAPPPQQPDSSNGLFALNRVSTASPIGVNRRTSVEPGMSSFATSDSASEVDLHSTSMYAPQRVKSLKDMRRPSLDVRPDNATGDAMLDGSAAANALFERSSGIRQSMAMNYLSGMSNLHRRHSLASANPLASVSSAASTSLGGVPIVDYNVNAAHIAESAFSTGDFGMYPPSTLQQNTYQQGSMFPTSYGAFAAHSVHVQRQQSMSVQPAMQNSQAQQQMCSFQQYPAPAPVGRNIAGCSSNGAPLMPQHLSSMAPRAGFYAGSFVGSQPIPPVPPLPQQQQQQQPDAIRPFQPMHIQQNQPPLLQPVPVPLAMQQQQPQSQSQRQQSQQQQQQQQQQQHQQSKQPQPTPQHHHMRRASHSAIVSMGHSNTSMALYPPMPLMNGGGSHTLLPNPATTITPNMPFADMGKGLPLQSLPKKARVFVVQFKGARCDLFFSPTKDMEVMIIPTLALSAVPVPTSEATPDRPSESQYKPGTHVLVEADRGVDLGVIREELLTDDAIKSFSSALSDSSPNSGSAFGDAAHSDGRSSVAPADGSTSLTSSSGHSSKPSSSGAGHSVSRKPSASETLSASLTGSSSGSSKDVLIKRIFRVADQREVADLTNNKVLDEQNALTMCQSKVQQRKLSMYVVDAEFQFDRRKLTFYFKADRRVDFRELVRELFKHFKTRIWMCQQTS